MRAPPNASVILTLLCLLLVYHPAIGEEYKCPSFCLCHAQCVVCRKGNLTQIPELVDYQPDSNGGALQYFSMTTTNLTRVPTNAFVGYLDLMHIDLSNNVIELVEDGAFSELPSLAQLSLRQNKLASLPNNIFDSLPNLEMLDLSFNKLRDLPISLERLVGLKILRLKGNPLNCPCNIVNLGSLLPKLEVPGNRATCASPTDVAGQYLSDIARQYSAAFRGSRHLGFQPDMYVFPEEAIREQLVRTELRWPLPHCRQGDLGGERLLVDDSSKPDEMPSITVPPEPVAVAEGERVFFFCEAIGYPTPTIRWVLPTNDTQYVRLWNNRKVSGYGVD